MRSHDYTEEIIQRVYIVGQRGAGGYSLMRRYTDDLFHEYWGNCRWDLDYKVKSLNCDGRVIRQEVYFCWLQDELQKPEKIQAALQRAHIILLAIDLTNEHAIQSIATQVDEIRKIKQQPIILVGTKCDLTNKISDAAKSNLQHASLHLQLSGCFFVSSKTGDEVEQPFKCAAKQYKSIPNQSKFSFNFEETRSAFDDTKSSCSIFLTALSNFLEAFLEMASAACCCLTSAFTCGLFANHSSKQEPIHGEIRRKRNAY